MSRTRFKVKLEDGTTIWITGKDISEAFLNGWRRIQEGLQSDCRKKDGKTFKTYTEEWLELYEKPKVSEIWYYTVTGILNNHLYPVFGEKLLNEISAEDIAKFYMEKGHYAKSTVMKMRNILKRVLDSAVEDGLLEKNVADSDRFVINGAKKERQPVSIETIHKISENLDKLDQNELLFVCFLLYTGMRRGEILPLKWSDLDFERNLIHVQRAASYKTNQPKIKEPKTNAGKRLIPMLPELRSVLLTVPADMRKEYIIGGEKLTTLTVYRRMWTRIIKKLEIEKVTAHQFRHSFTSEAKKVLDPKTLQEILDHSNVVTTLNNYAHVSDEDVIDAGEKLSNIYQQKSVKVKPENG